MKATVIFLLLSGVWLQAHAQGVLFTETKYNVGKSPEQSKVTDVNGDGLLDVVVLTERKDTGYVKILYQNSLGVLQLSPTEYCTQNGADMVNTGDINNDGKTDIAVTTDDAYANRMAFLYQQSGGTFNVVFEVAPGTPTSAGCADVGDMNGDGLNDVVRGNKPRNSISIYYQATDHSLDTAIEYPVGAAGIITPRTSDGRIADFNNDGKKDFAVRNGTLTNGNAFFTMYYNLGGGSFNIVNYDTHIPSVMGISDIRTADMDNNGLADVVVSVHEGTVVIFLQQTGGGFVSSSSLPGIGNIRGIALGDINGDGRKDIIASGFDCHQGISLLLQDMSGGYRAPVKLVSPTGFGGFVDVGDVNNDHLLDIIITNGLLKQTTNCPNDYISVIEIDRSSLITPNVLQNNFPSIYPNPCYSYTTVHSDLMLHDAVLTVYNCLGQAVKQIKNISGQDVTLPCDGLAAGPYFIRLTQDNGLITTGTVIIAD